MKHYAAAMAILLATASAHWYIQIAQDRAARESPSPDALSIPSTIGPFIQAGEDYQPGERILELLQTSTVLIRDYISPQGPVQLTIVYTGTTRRSMHFPEVCLVGQGWEVRQQAPHPVGILFTAKELVLVRGNQQEAVLYWFKTGRRLTGSYLANAWYWARNQITFGAPTSAMIKITTPIGPRGEQAAFDLLEDFAMKLTPILMETIR